jgi:radical SAM family uncharacterized protein/radical SAM-linked protein
LYHVPEEVIGSDGLRHPYAEFLHLVEKPARYVGGEYHQIVKDPASVRVRLALAFPDVYDIGMSHLGTRILYALVNAREDLAVERAFCPWPDCEEQLRARGLPLVTLESATPLAQMDALGFSLQYELTYTNVLTMLDLAGLPLRAADRDERHPLVVAGGPCATQPEPMAPFVDVFLIGEAEDRLPEMLQYLGDLRDAGASRRETLVELAKLGGLYAPALYDTVEDERTGLLAVGAPTEEGVPERVERLVVDLADHPFPDDGPVAGAEAVFDRMGIEIARGCHEGCRFCQAGVVYRPARERDPEDLAGTILRAVGSGGYDEVGLTTLSTADYSCIAPFIKRIMPELRDEKVSLSVASLRAYGLDEDLLDEIRSVRATNLTFAPEAGTERLRGVINKNVSDDDLERTAHRIFRLGWRRMKLYFMLGLPTETDEDLEAILAVGRRMKEIGTRYFKPRRLSITVSVSTHVPKPHTPFQWCAFDSMEEIDRKQRLLATGARRERVELRTHDGRLSHLECLLGRGDRRMANVIEDAWRRGARFDSWDDRLAWGAWTTALREHAEIGAERLTGELPIDARLPWNHIDIGVKRAFLEREHRRAMDGRTTRPCGKPGSARVHHTNLADHEADDRKLVCHACGVECDLDAMRAQRGAFLEKLGALERPAAREADGESPRPKRHDPRGTAPHDFVQGEPVRYRLILDRLMPAILTGHLDWVRALPRIVRRAGLPAWYTEGFHPKPRMEFPPALPLGAASLDEAVDIALTERMPEPELVDRLRAAAPAGVIFTDAIRLGPGARKLNRDLAAIEFLVRVDAEQIAALGLGDTDLDDAPAALLARDEIPWTVTRRRQPKEVDLRPAIDDVRWVLADEVPARLDFHREGARHLRVRIRLDAPDIHARPEEVASAMLGEDPGFQAIQLARTALLRAADAGWSGVHEIRF